MLIHKLPQTPYTAFPLDWQVWGRKIQFILHSANVFWAMDLVGKPNTTSPIWNHFHSCHPSAFVQVSSSSRDRKRPAGQVCVGEAFSKLAKYKRDSGKWKMPTRNVATYAAIPIPQRARADEELTLPLAWWRNSEPCSVARLGGFPAVLNLIVRVNIGLGGWTKFGPVFGQFGGFQNI